MFVHCVRRSCTALSALRQTTYHQRRVDGNIPIADEEGSSAESRHARLCNYPCTVKKIRGIAGLYTMQLHERSSGVRYHCHPV